jgi:hypothetical protein
MRNKKLELHKQLVREMLTLLDGQEHIEEVYEFDLNYCIQKENECIMEYSAKLAGLNQLSFQQINARVIGTIVINENGVATAL